MISKTESGRVGYRKKYRVAGRVRVPAGHCCQPSFPKSLIKSGDFEKPCWGDMALLKKTEHSERDFFWDTPDPGTLSHLAGEQIYK